MKKLLSLMLAVCLFLFFACSGDERETESSEGSVENLISTESSEENSEESSVMSEESSVISEESSVISEESSVVSEESSVVSEESGVVSEETDPSSSDVIEAFCGGRFEGKETVKLVALGDSIARGHGLSDPSAQSYPAILSQTIEAVLDGAKVDYTNLAVDGMKTHDLLSLLQSEAISFLSGADIVVLCIGANNILGPFTAALEGAGSDFSGNVAGGSSDAFGVFIDQFNAMLKSEAFAADMRTGIAEAAKELPQILDIIKDVAPNAIVAVMTVYSPYHGMVMSIPYLGKSVNLGEASDEWVSLLNAEIRNVVNAENCVLVETYDAFEQGTDLINAKFNLIPFKMSFDPHPNINGHIKLANLYMAVLSKL